MNKEYKPIIHLNLTSNWYDMIDQGIKKEEYREDKDYWNRIFVNGRIKVKGVLYDPDEVVICFSNGYSKVRRQMYFQIVDLTFGEGLEEWGAVKGKKYNVLHLGDKLVA